MPERHNALPELEPSSLLAVIEFTETQVKNFRRSLLSWYPRHRRAFPWREEPSLYRTVVSEFMLQQTQVSTVLPYFERWMKRFPDFETLANARESDVLKHWEGLGYYNRARNLRRLAEKLSGRKSMPETPEAWRELPGVGPYTAAAVTSIAFGARAACVDGNVVRILSRIHSDDTEFRDGGAAARAYTATAAALLDPARPGDHNQAMMELGATVCFRTKPLCTTCPLLRFCRAGQGGDPEKHPVLAAKKVTRVEVPRLWCRRDNSLLLHRASGTARRLADLYELPDAQLLGLEAGDTESLGPILLRRKRSITRYRITETIHRYSPPRGRKVPLSAGSGLEWIPLDRLNGITLSGPHRKWVDELIAAEGEADSDG